ncbi:MAG: TraB/GumN family protein [Idiomarina sp.]|nr:TraB/GumN family protein [Idiomarina sp.]
MAKGWVCNAFVATVFAWVVLIPPAQSELLFRADWPERTLWLLGTVKISNQSNSALSDLAKGAIVSSYRVWLEMTSDELSRSSDVLFRAGLRDEPFLKEELEPDTWAELAAITARLGLAPSVIDRMDPWLVDYVVTLLALRAEGFDTRLGVDHQVTRHAVMHHRDIEGLERAEDLLQVLQEAHVEKEPEARIQALLDSVRQAPRLLTEMEIFWRNGDLNSLNYRVRESLTEYDQHILLVERNQRWYRSVLGAMGAEGEYFVAVGAEHLAGDQGLLALFERQGATISRAEAMLHQVE